MPPPLSNHRRAERARRENKDAPGSGGYWTIAAGRARSGDGHCPFRRNAALATHHEKPWTSFQERNNSVTTRLPDSPGVLPNAVPRGGGKALAECRLGHSELGGSPRPTVFSVTVLFGADFAESNA